MPTRGVGTEWPPTGRGHSFQARAKALRGPQNILGPIVAIQTIPTRLRDGSSSAYLLHLLQTIGLETAAPPPVGWRALASRTSKQCLEEIYLIQ